MDSCGQHNIVSCGLRARSFETARRGNERVPEAKGQETHQGSDRRGISETTRYEEAPISRTSASTLRERRGVAPDLGAGALTIGSKPCAR